MDSTQANLGLFSSFKVFSLPWLHLTYCKWAIAVQRVLHSQQRTNALTHLLLFQRLPIATTIKFCSK